MRTIAIDIRGTKFSMAVFEGDRIIRRESRATDRDGGKGWMLGKIAAVGRSLGIKWRPS